MTPRFCSGQTVRFSARVMRRSVVTGDYQIVRQLPDERGEQQYLIKALLSLTAASRRKANCNRHDSNFANLE